MSWQQELGQKYIDYGLMSKDFIGPREEGDYGPSDSVPGARKMGQGSMLGRWSTANKPGFKAPPRAEQEARKRHDRTYTCQGHCVCVTRDHQAVWVCDTCGRSMGHGSRLFSRLGEFCGKQYTVSEEDPEPQSNFYEL